MTHSVLTALDDLVEESRNDEHVMTSSPKGNEVSPWLNMTRWPKYLAGKTSSAVARLAQLPNLHLESVLARVCESLDRIVETAYKLVCEDRINAFDQVRINSFM